MMVFYIGSFIMSMEVEVEDRFEKFTFLINKIYRDIQKLKLITLKKYGLKGSHMMCLYHLGQVQDGVNFKELCEICDEDKGLISRNLSYLKDKGLVDYDVSDTKKYKTKLRLSDKGIQVFNEIQEITSNVCNKVYLDKDDESLDLFYKDLEDISIKIDDYLNGEQNK